MTMGRRNRCHGDSKRGPRTAATSSTWASVGHADSQVPPQNQNLHFLPDAQVVHRHIKV